LEVWRELKAQELAQKEKQEVVDAASREKELQEALGSAIEKPELLK